MDTLLNQLKEQDLELYQEIVADLLPSSDHRNNFIICGKLQERIRARGWLLEQSTFTVKPTAKIWKSSDPIWRTYHEGGDTDAETLLRAYLAAIQAEVKA